VPNAVASIAELAALKIDVAHVLVPPNLHLAVTRELLELGIGAFVEKPLALSTADARTLTELAEQRDVVLGVNHNAAFHPAFQRLLERLRSGEIGRVEHVRVCLSVPLRQLDAGDFSHWMFREPRNIIFEQCPHPFAQLVELVGGVRVLHTTMLGSRELQPGQLFHERWVVAGRGERGSVELFLHFGAAFTRSTLEVLGSDGSLEADLFHNQLAGESKTLYLDFWNSFLAGWRRGGELRKSARRVLTDYLKLTLGLGQREDAFFAGMRGSIRAFHAAYRSGTQLPADGRTGEQVLAWCEAATSWIQERAAPTISIPPAGAARPGEVVVLGGTGFLGRRCVQRLRAQGRPVTLVVRKPNLLPAELRDGSVRVFVGDAGDAATLAAAFAGATAVLHLATAAGDDASKVEAAMAAAVRAAGEQALAAKVARFVYTSSTAALWLGDPGRIDGRVGPDPRPADRSAYARGKIAAEHEVTALRGRGLAAVVVRPAIVVGEGGIAEHSGVGLWVRDNHCVGWGHGDAPLPFVLADDCADALVAALAAPAAVGASYNLAGAVRLTAREYVAELSARSGRAVQFHGTPLRWMWLQEVGKYAVKALARRPRQWPAFRDFASRSFATELDCADAARDLGFRPEADRARFLDRAFAGIAR
jgi:predicted dehydrogenase/nucleoside-diphosphate-sugar epimerase